MFEYIGEMGKDYINAVTPLLEDALMDRDLVHRQTASSVVGHMALGVAGLGCEAPLVHLLNYVWPNIFEVSPHVVQVRRQGSGGYKRRTESCELPANRFGGGTEDGGWNAGGVPELRYWRAARCYPYCVSGRSAHILAASDKQRHA
jgi:hypothetical protein